jgi:hypothetical protein
VNNVTNKSYNVSEEQMKQIKGKSIDTFIVARSLAPKPSYEEIKRKN